MNKLAIIVSIQLALMAPFTIAHASDDLDEVTMEVMESHDDSSEGSRLELPELAEAPEMAEEEVTSHDADEHAQEAQNEADEHAQEAQNEADEHAQEAQDEADEHAQEAQEDADEHV